jgi:serine/threonine-protein kinase
MNSIPPVIKLALEKKLISEKQYEQCKDILKKSKKIGLDTTIEEIVVKQGIIEQEQLEELKHICELGSGTGQIFGHYRLGKLIGEGGMGKVYEATHEFMGRIVAIKVINQEITSDKTKALRFFQEIRALVKLNHPNIVTIFDAGRVQKNYYYAMEYLPGPSLKDYVNSKRFLSEKEALSIIKSIASALAHAHANNVIHRDVKPENIIFDSNHIPKLTDFGIAMHHDEHHLTLTQEGITVGSLHYTSPEQIDGKRDIDCRADIYSLGATLYYTLTGHNLYTASTPQELITKHLSGNYLSPRKINKQISLRTTFILKKMLAKNREKRYQSMQEVIKAIDKPSLKEKLRLFAFFVVTALICFIIGIIFESVLKFIH